MGTIIKFLTWELESRNSEDILKYPKTIGTLEAYLENAFFALLIISSIASLNFMFTLDPDSEVVVFAKRTVKDLKLPPAFITQIAQSIQVRTIVIRTSLSHSSWI